MPDLLLLMAGAEVQCTDGRVGHVGGLIFDPATGTLTHVSVATRSASQMGRLVPLDHVQSAGPPTQLDCTKDEYHAFAPNEEFDAVGGPRDAKMMHVSLTPHGEIALEKDETVHATDGRAGHLVGAAVDPDSRAVRELLVQIGHFGARHQVSVPFDAVTGVDKHGIHLRLSKDELSGQTGLS